MPEPSQSTLGIPGLVVVFGELHPSAPTHTAASDAEKREALVRGAQVPNQTN